MWSCSGCTWEFLGRFTRQFLEDAQGQNCWAVDSVSTLFSFLYVSVYVVYVYVFLYVAYECIPLSTEDREGHWTSISIIPYSLPWGWLSLTESGEWLVAISFSKLSPPETVVGFQVCSQPWLYPCAAFDTGTHDLNTGSYAWVMSGL